MFTFIQFPWKTEKLVGGFKYCLCSTLFGEDEPILTHIFQMGWFNHQLEKGGGKFAPEIRRVFRDLDLTEWVFSRPMRRDLPPGALLFAFTFTLVGLASASRPSLLYLGPLEGGKTGVKRPCRFEDFYGPKLGG